MIRNIQHITFPVTDLKRTIDFSENSLGLKKTGEWDNYAVFDVGGVDLALQPKTRFQIFLIVDNVDEAYRTVKGKGVELVTEPKDEYWGGRTTEFADPNGNKFIMVSFKK